MRRSRWFALAILIAAPMAQAQISVIGALAPLADLEVALAVVGAAFLTLAAIRMTYLKLVDFLRPGWDYEADAVACDRCGSVEYDDEMYDVDGEQVCRFCYSDEFVADDLNGGEVIECERCGEHVDEADATYHNGQDVCINCYEESGAS